MHRKLYANGIFVGTYFRFREPKINVMSWTRIFLIEILTTASIEKEKLKHNEKENKLDIKWKEQTSLKKHWSSGISSYNSWTDFRGSRNEYGWAVVDSRAVEPLSGRESP